MALRLRRHDPAARARYEDLKQLALTQRRALAGAPGTLKHRTQGGKRYWVREYIRVDGRKADEYLGAESALPAARVTAFRHELELARALAAGSSALRLFGYQRIDRKPAAVLAALFNRGLFAAGLTLVGSHAYGVLLNELGVSAAGYRTQDIDVARSRPLKIALPEDAPFHAVLEESGLRLAPVPGLSTRQPATSFKLPGAEGLAVDLLIPGREAGKVLAAPELHAFAQAIPWLDFLVEEPVEAIVLSPNQVIPVKVPAPERMALHKLYASQARRTLRDKARKDIDQAVVLAAALEQDTPGRLTDTFKELPRAARPAVARGALAASRQLGEPHAHARDALLWLAKKTA